MSLWCTAVAQHGLGRDLESEEALDARIARFPDQSTYQIAAVHAWRGEADRAFEWLERAFALRDNGLNMMKAPPASQLARGTRHTALLRKLGVPVD